MGFLEVLGAIEVSAANAELGMRLWGTAQRMRDEIDGGPPRSMLMADPVHGAQEAIGAEAVDAAMAAGRAMTTATAVALALGKDTAAEG